MSTSKELPTVLLITKDLFQIAFFKKLLKKTFYVVELEEEESWIEWIKDPSLALILINEKTLEAPLLNLCRHIRKFTLPSLPILVISNQLQDSFLSKAKEVGVFDTIQEPFLESTVLQQIERSLATKTVQKKIKQITSKLKPPLSIPKNTRLFLEKMLIRASSLEKISEAKETASPLGVLIIQLDLMDRLHHDLGKSSMHLKDA